MANQWFRMYHEFATDPKIQRLSEVDQRRYIMLLCLRCCNGDVTLQDEDVTFMLRVTPEEWGKTKAVLLDKKLIDSDNKPTAWDKRQYVSDSSAARVSKHRALQKQACNVTVTPPEQIQNRTDTEKDKKTSRFVKPSISEIKAYIAEKKYDVNADKFFNHYEANGWVRGKTKIKNWKACVATWANNDNNGKGQKSAPMPKEFRGFEYE